ncbi:MAG TPA: DCC1-like thiol-disulfide oxidoreductase family protein [Gemmatimonadales bacterium]|nr:DCC1-like thiol-disulfide oxidoreductase family protein [Gemmatimonadales bacterium]
MSAPGPGAGTGGPLLLYDGTCGFCAESVRFVLRHDRRGTLRFAPLQGAAGAAVRAANPELERVDSMVWVEPARAGAPGGVYTRSDAALRVARYLGGGWHLARLGRLVPRPLRDAAYDLVARHRHRLTSGGPSCLMPAANVRARFLD